MDKFTNLGFGLGLRTDHYHDILNGQPDLDWFEILTENYLVPGGKPLYYLDEMVARYPVAMHGVSMSIGSSDPLNMDYLNAVKTLASRIQAHWLSDHLCWTGMHGKNAHDLLPMPYTEEALKHIVDRVKQVQEFLGRQILLENVSSYLTYQYSAMEEWVFLSEVAKQADCYILLDINNIYVSSRNHHFDPLIYLNHIPVDRVKQFHLAGHHDYGDYIIDTHDAPVVPDVWQLYVHALQRFKDVPTLLERDDHIPPLSELLLELNQAKQYANQTITNTTRVFPVYSESTK